MLLCDRGLQTAMLWVGLQAAQWGDSPSSHSHCPRGATVTTWPRAVPLCLAPPPRSSQTSESLQRRPSFRLPGCATFPTSGRLIALPLGIDGNRVLPQVFGILWAT